MAENIYESERYLEDYHKTPGPRINNILNNIEITDKEIIGDFACGNGLLPKALVNKYEEYNGIDFSSSFIKECNKWVQEAKPRNTYFFKEDIVNFCSKNKSKYTKAFTLDFSEHIYDDEFIEIYQAIRESMKRNALLIIHTPNKDFFLEKLKYIGVIKQTSGHIEVRNMKEYKRLLRKCGYKEIKVKYLPHYNKILSSFPGSRKARLLIICRK